MVKIKNVKKFKNLNMRIVGTTIYLICNSREATIKLQEYDDKKLLTDVYNIGKKFNKVINQYFKKEKEKISSEIITFNKLDIKEKNEKIIELFKTNCSRDFRNGFSQINNNINEEEKEEDIFIEMDKYVAFYDFFKNSYNLLNENKIDLKKLLNPSEINDIILYEKYGINSSTIIRNTSTTLELNYLNLLDLLENNKNKLDYTPLISKINYIPLNVKHLFSEIIENKTSNEYSQKVFSEIKKFCTNYGLPYWKKDINDKYEIEIPMNNFIFIILTTYIYIELWDKLLTYEKYDEWEDFIYSFYVLNIDFDYHEAKSNIIKKLVKSIESIDFYIMNNCNELLGRKINIHRKKVLDKSTNTLGNETIYESIIFAVWDIFYLYYFGSNKKFKPVIYEICSNCNMEIRDKSHTIKNGNKAKICQKCYIERKNQQNKERVKKYREKNSV